MWGILPGQAAMHFPQPVHFSWLTKTALVFLLTDKASKGQALTQG